MQSGIESEKRVYLAFRVFEIEMEDGKIIRPDAFLDVFSTEDKAKKAVEEDAFDVFTSDKQYNNNCWDKLDFIVCGQIMYRIIERSVK